MDRAYRRGDIDSGIVTCRQAYGNLSAQWKSMIDAATDLWGKEAYTRMSTAQAAAKLKQDVPVVAAAFTNSSADYVGTMRQMTAINAFMQARDNMAGGLWRCRDRHVRDDTRRYPGAQHLQSRSRSRR
ncbi:hypothetical protein ACVOMT_22465 [Sphingomonas panni]